MDKQKQLFLAQPDLAEMESTVLAARSHSLGMAVAVADNIVRPAGGGEPRDRGSVRYSDTPSCAIVGAEKGEGLTWLILPNHAGELCSGRSIVVNLDMEHRQRRRRLHTAIHLAIRTTINHLGRGFQVADAQIEDDALTCWFSGRFARSLTDAEIISIDRSMRSLVLSARPVNVATAKSVEHAERSYGELFRMSDRYALSGRVRLVCVEDFDVNPCSGLHHVSSDIGPYALDRHAAPGGFTLRIQLTNAWNYWHGTD
ncbi:hypothetical protein [Bradyrhizobium sp. 18]|uniref:hypothetical protein n=1 Tax=Bradyrhizobium sp. 18 TaxID=2782657 RepID=UPI001FFB779A|nr:hypothetical protein [Bradyrhizobium sp. 18]MCK1504529.1 hypothetical protein [Bradyrhizobium sp. 18]